MVLELGDAILALAAAVAPAYVAMINYYNGAKTILDECLTLREQIANKLARCTCQDPQRIRRALESTPCEYISREISNTISIASLSFLGIYMMFIFYMVLQGEIFWQTLFLAMAALMPYVGLISLIRGLPAGLLAGARVFVASEDC